MEDNKRLKPTGPTVLQKQSFGIFVCSEEFLWIDRFDYGLGIALDDGGGYD